MRKVIGYENALGVGNHLLLEGSVKWEVDKQFHIVWNFDYTVNNLLGHASDLRREDDGAITAELDFRDADIAELVKRDNLPATFEGNDVVQEVFDGVRVFHSVTVRGIAIVAPPSVPW